MINPADWHFIGLKPADSPSPPPGLAAPTGGVRGFGALRDSLPRWADGNRNRLRIGLACPLHWGAARRLVRDFRQARPDIELIVEDGDEGGLSERLEAGRIDLIIGPDGLGRRGWRMLPLERERLIAVLPEAHHLCSGNEVQPADLLAQPILLAGRRVGSRAFRHAVVEALGRHPTFKHHAVQRDTLFDLIALGFGVTVSVGGAFGAFYPGVVLRQICSKAGAMGFSLLWLENADKPALSAFLSAARDSACGAKGGGLARAGCALPSS
jgi:DNA-binding transcriptional LysR family regulator